MNTWTDSGLSEAGLIGAMLALGVEARLPGRGGRRRAAEPGAAASGLTGSFPLTGAAKLYTPAPVPLPAEPLPPEPARPEPARLQPARPEPDSERARLQPARPEPDSERARLQPARPEPDSERDEPRSPTDGFLAGGFSSASTDSPWDRGDLSTGLPHGLGGSWSRPVPITPQAPLDAAVSAPTARVRESGSPPRETFTVESDTLGSLDSSDLFAALSRRGR